jgi:hypothetical protein
MNGYPRHFIDNAMKTPQNKVCSRRLNISLLFVYHTLNGPASHKIERILKNEAGIKVYHSSENKLFRALCTHFFINFSVSYYIKEYKLTICLID